MGASATLKRFATSRDKAFKISGYLTDSKAKAITKIMQVAEYFSNQPELVQLRAVNTVEAEIRLLLPHEQSRFSKLREQLLTLLDLSKTQCHAQTSSRIPQAADERSATPKKGAHGTQLQLI